MYVASPWAVWVSHVEVLAHEVAAEVACPPGCDHA